MRDIKTRAAMEQPKTRQQNVIPRTAVRILQRHYLQQKQERQTRHQRQPVEYATEQAQQGTGRCRPSDFPRYAAAPAEICSAQIPYPKGAAAAGNDGCAGVPAGYVALNREDYHSPAHCHSAAPTDAKTACDCYDRRPAAGKAANPSAPPAADAPADESRRPQSGDSGWSQMAQAAAKPFAPVLRR